MRNSLWPAVLLCASVAASAQTTTGSVRGLVEDSGNARLAGASIRAELVGSPHFRVVAADALGEFRLENLTPGSWRMSVSAPGFSIAASDVTVSVGTVRSLTVTMRPASVQQAAGVSAHGSSIASEPIDLSSSVHQAIVTSQDLDSLPLPARSFANIAYLAPGTEPVEPSDPTKARITAVSTGGSSGLNNELSVDGADDSDDFVGGFLQNISPDAFSEFTIRTSQQDADAGSTHRRLGRHPHQVRDQRTARDRRLLRARSRPQRPLPNRKSRA